MRVDLKPADGTAMRGYLALPDKDGEGEARAPGVIVFPEAFGVNGPIKDAVHRLAGAGFAAMAVELYHRTAPSGYVAPYDFNEVKAHYEAAVRPEPLALDVRAAYEHLAAQPFCDGTVSAIGFCLGGRVAFFANSIVPLKAAVCFYGGRIDPKQAASAHGKTLLIYGGKDKGIPAPERDAVTAALRAAGKPFVESVFDEAGHGFANTERKELYHEASANEAWALALEFLKAD